MASQEPAAARERTDSKLRYAAVHLEELRAMQRRGSDPERAHQESYLFHLLGVPDALLQEMNAQYALGLTQRRVSVSSIATELHAAGRTSGALTHMLAVERDPKSWLNCAKDMRNHVTHRASVPRHFYQGGPRHNQASLVDTRTNKEIDQDYLVLYDGWFSDMNAFVKDVRSKM
ncbi:MAG: hypothetical protein ABFD77_03005 [Thermotogota bacterium]